MPGFTTHYLMGMKAYNDLPNNNVKHIISKYRWLYQLGLQGPDMFFYNIPILRHRDYRNVGSYMHEHCVREFFVNYLKMAVEIPSKQQREQAMAYFCGFLCHYIGDSICHPYVYGRIQNGTGNLHGLHAQLENDLDALLLYKYKKKKPSEFNQAATICLNGMETQFISRFLSCCINETYYPITYSNSFQVSPRMVHRSILAMRFGCRTLSDPTGRKRVGLELLEDLFRRNAMASKKLVTDTVDDPQWSLNLEHETWTNPWNRQLASTASFPSLFRRCLQKCSTVYYLLNQAISGGTPPEKMDFSLVIEELGNYSYHSGLPVN